MTRRTILFLAYVFEIALRLFMVTKEPLAQEGDWDKGWNASTAKMKPNRNYNLIPTISWLTSKNRWKNIKY
jgi:hypothetical protein